MHGYWGGPMGFGWMGGVFMLTFWGLIIIGIVWLVRYLMSSRSCDIDHPDTPLEILKKQYAKGEIDKNAYEENKKDIGM